MKKNKFNLLQRAYPDASASKDERIQALRAKARGYQNIHNDLVEQLWEVDQNMVRLQKEEDRLPLMDKKADLVRKIDEADYIKKIDVLLEEIKALEIVRYGHSDIGSNSPYAL